MRRVFHVAILAASAMALGACANHSYVAGPGMSAAQLAPDSAGCRLYAEGSRPDTSFAAYGSPKGVAIATGAALLVGGVLTAVHDSEAYDNCMQSRGWLVADNASTSSGGAKPVAAPGQTAVTPWPMPIPPGSLAYPMAATIDPATAARQAQEEQAAASWVAAQNILNGPATAQRNSLYATLCHTGDQSACLMADGR